MGISANPSGIHRCVAGGNKVLLPKAKSEEVAAKVRSALAESSQGRYVNQTEPIATGTVLIGRNCPLIGFSTVSTPLLAIPFSRTTSSAQSSGELN